ncbi:MAG TPA: TonB-dependent receptor plug domain-containing protein [Acetobacteraceae bacterium]|nr:TonB-dependent receptor plug domain-containing protein [Acetobacteraceae bacterium]
MRLNRSALQTCTAIGIVTALLPPLAPEARAQKAASPPPGAIEQVIVTARRRAENLQKVPVAVTALSGATLRRQQIVSQYDLNRVTPSLQISISAGGGQNQSEIALRGQRQGDTLPSLDPSVGVYFGDIVVERPYGFSQQFFDLSNVQVLKGPQGTLFGRNTTGGNILLVPNAPTDKYDGMLHTSLGDYNLHEVDGWVNLPFSDQVQLRIAGQHTDRDGYITDLTTGKDDENVDEQALRASLKIKVNDDITNTTVLNWSDSSNNGTGYRLVALGPPASLVYNSPYVYPPGGYGDQVLKYERGLPYYDTATSGVFGGGYAYTHVLTLANTTTWTINDYLNFKNIIGYDHYNVGQGDQVSGSILPLLAYAEQQGGDQFTEEFQVYGKTERLNYIGGLYFFREQAFNTSYTPQELNPVLLGQVIPQVIPDHDTNYSESMFGQATYDFSDWVPGLTGTFGARETWDQRNADFGTIYNVTNLPPFSTPGAGGFCAFSVPLNGVPNGGGVNFQPYPSCRTQQSVSFNKFTYNVDVDYHFSPDQMIYFAHRLGYRSGGFGTRAVNVEEITPFAPETVNDYELGVKADWHLPGGVFLRTNAAIFDQDYSNLQRLIPVVIGGAQSTDVLNVGSATINGAELEVTFVPVPWLTLNGFLSQVQPKFNQFIIPAAYSPTGQTLDATKTAVFGGFPRTTFGLTARATLPGIPERYGDFVLQANYYHQSGYMQQDSGVSQPFQTAPGYGVVNFRAEWDSIFGTKFDLAAFVTNLGDNHYIAATYTLDSPTSLGFASTIAAPPRMFGFEGTYHFGP